jgi:EAL domain-containing protein (putative c-di-GMP-specific phosphodiesterase class I)
MLPDAFIALAEEAGLTASIRRSVLEQACAARVAWQRAGLCAAEAFVAVNVSARDLRDPLLVDEILDVLEASGLEPAALLLEMTESAALSASDAAASTLGRLHRAGVRFALDDFGTGYSSLGHLGNLPVDVLKVPKPFVDRLIDGDTERAVTATIIGLAASLGLECVAEGVETPEQAGVLQDLGCELGQGFLFARPADPAVVKRWLLARKEAPAASLAVAPS